MSRSPIMRSDDLRAENRHRVLRSLRNSDSLSRASMGDRTGLSQAALSSLLSTLSDQGIVCSQRESVSSTKPGRPQKAVRLADDAGICVSIALTVDRYIVRTSSYSGKTLSESNVPTVYSELNASALSDLLVDSIETVIAAHPNTPLLAISVGFQGVTDSNSGDLMWTPIMSVDRIPIAAQLRNKFSVAVSVNNDCALIAASLHRREQHVLGSSFAAILFSHGIGMGVFLDGKPLSGANSSALELGHIQYREDGAPCRCGKRGCIEAYAADYGIVRSASGNPQSPAPMGKITAAEFEQLVVAAKSGDQAAAEAFRQAGKALGFGLATLFTLFDPMPVAMIGHNAKAVRLIMRSVENELDSVFGKPIDCSTLIHFYDDELSLLLDGLSMKAMALADRRFADFTTGEQVVRESALS